VLFRLESDRKALDIIDDELRLHWSYFGQADPDLVLNVLRDLRLRAIPESRSGA
jgi:hypothetical protein